MQGTAGIVGAGIGGLAAGIALRDAGWDVTVYERAPELAPLGAGLSLWPNGVRALRELGIDPEESGAPRPTGALRRADGSLLAEFDPDAIEARYGAPLVGTHRADLHAALADRLGRDRLRLAAEATAGADGAVSIGGATVEADLLVGADGINSAVRAGTLADGPPVDSGIVAFRGVTPAPEDIPAGEWWGEDSIAGLLPLGDGRAYWYVSYRGEDEGRDGLPQAVARFGPPLPEIAAATPADAVLIHRLMDRPPADSWSRGTTTLLGDAAHPMLPFLGQGANAALQDAVALGRAMAGASGVEPGLHAYEDERVEPAAKLVKGSRQASRVALAGSAAARAIRNGFVRILPPSARLRQLDGFIGRP